LVLVVVFFVVVYFVFVDNGWMVVLVDELGCTVLYCICCLVCFNVCLVKIDFLLLLVWLCAEYVEWVVVVCWVLMFEVVVMVVVVYVMVDVDCFVCVGCAVCLG